MVGEILTDYSFETPYRDFISDTSRIADRLDDAWDNGAAPLPFEAVEVLKPVFYRRKGAYLIGRAHGGGPKHGSCHAQRLRQSR
ncbi:bifunctional isocitrate dehydrogenase kinase/phosphatase [bacterium]|nr:bifunctional isocitrate dehydrogenase kinase/phosphatase [bacterium]